MGKSLKYILFTLSLLTAGLLVPERSTAQHYVGVRGGYGGGSTRVYPAEETRSLWGLYHGGVSWKYYSPEKYVGGVQADLLFMQQGYISHDSPYDRDTGNGNRYPRPPVSNDPDEPKERKPIYEERYVNSIMVPLFWQPHIYMFRRNMRIFLNAGVTFSYNLNQQQAIVSEVDGVLEPKTEYKTMRTRDNRWGYGLCGGGGVGWSFGRIEVLAEVRYYIGYSDLMKNRNKYYGNPLRSPLDGLQGSFGVYYRFGKKGILSPPSRNMEKKLRELEEKREARARVSEIVDDPAVIRDAPVIMPDETVPDAVPAVIPDEIPDGDGPDGVALPENAVLASLR